MLSYQIQKEPQEMGPLLLSCAQCDKKFKKNSNMKVHIDSHKNKRVITCTICKKTMSSLQNHKAHKDGHAGKQIYRCELCERRFTRKDSLTKHQKFISDKSY